MKSLLARAVREWASGALKEIHSATHPAKARSARVQADSSVTDQSAIVAAPTPTADDILAVLVAEADEEHDDDA
jgi:hypothetical protein